MLSSRRPLPSCRFIERRIPFEFEGAALSVASAEDLVIAKLEWAKQGDSRRQLEDVASLLELRREHLDLNYMTRWIEALGLGAQWDDARQMAGANRDHV